MLERAKKLLEETKAFAEKDAAKIEEFRIKILGSKGELKKLFAEFRNVPSEQKKEFGVVLNDLREKAETKIAELKASLHSSSSNDSKNGED
jgi:phenylalanyl-tRNA synthetase alpha chain